MDAWLLHSSDDLGLTNIEEDGVAPVVERGAGEMKRRRGRQGWVFPTMVVGQRRPDTVVAGWWLLMVYWSMGASSPVMGTTIICVGLEREGRKKEEKKVRVDGCLV